MYNDEDENEVENEEDYDDEYEQEEEEQYVSYNSSRPPFTNNPALDLKNKAGKAGKEAAKQAAKAVFQAIKSVVQFVVSNPIILVVIVVIVIIAMIWLVLSEELTKKTTSSVNKYILNSKTIDSTAKSLYVERHSLILLKLSEINEIYDAFIKDKSVTGDIRRAMKIKVGKNNVEKKKATQPKNGSSNSSGNSSGNSASASGTAATINEQGVATLGGPYNPEDNQVLSKSAGRVNFEGHTETYYSQRVLPGGGLDIPGRHVASDGTIRDENDYVCVASDDLPKGTLINTSLGMGKVYDCGSTHNNIDIYVDW